MYRFLVFLLLFVFNSTYALDIGVGIHPETFPSSPQTLITLLKKNHISTFRTDYPWSQVEKQKGIYQPANEKIENIIQLAKKNNIKPLIIYDYGNSLYEEKTLVNPRSKPSSEQSIQHFVNYVSWSTNHLKDNVSMFEIWNEWIQMAGKGNKDTALSDDSAKIYANLTLESCKAIKKINPNAIVIAGSTTPLDESSNRWLFKVINYGILNCIDGISLHPYDFNFSKKLDYKNIIQSLKKLQLIVTYLNHGKQVPFYITETGAPSVIQAKYDNNEIANYFTNYMRELSELDFVRSVWWYDFINDGNDLYEKEHNFGILNRDFSPKPIALKFADTIKKYK